MAEAFSRMPVTFEGECRTAEDFARRFRVLASMAEGGVTFSMSPEGLRGWAAVMERAAARPEVCVEVIEVEPPLSWPVAVLLSFLMAGQAVIFGEAVARVLWGLAG